MIPRATRPPPRLPTAGRAPSRVHSSGASAVGQSMVAGSDSVMPSMERTKTGSSIPQPPPERMAAITSPWMPGFPQT